VKTNPNEELNPRPIHPSVVNRLDGFSWETLISMSHEYNARIDDRRAELRKFEKQLNLMHLLLMEKIREQHKEESIEPKILVDLIRLIEHAQHIEDHYEVDLTDFNTYLYLVVQKIKKHKLDRIVHKKNSSHTPNSRRYRPLNEDEHKKN
jgi:hypothetical protein